MALLWLKTCLLMVASVAVVQSAPALGDSASFSGGSIELTPVAGGFVLGHVVNTSGQVVNDLHLELGYTNLFGERKTKIKNFSFEKSAMVKASYPSPPLESPFSMVQKGYPISKIRPMTPPKPIGASMGTASMDPNPWLGSSPSLCGLIQRSAISSAKDLT